MLAHYVTTPVVCLQAYTRCRRPAPPKVTVQQDALGGGLAGPFLPPLHTCALYNRPLARRARQGLPELLNAEGAGGRVYLVKHCLRAVQDEDSGESLAQNVLAAALTLLLLTAAGNVLWKVAAVSWALVAAAVRYTTVALLLVVVAVFLGI